jgi:hypothetical protein
MRGARSTRFAKALPKAVFSRFASFTSVFFSKIAISVYEFIPSLPQHPTQKISLLSSHLQPSIL